MKDYTVWIHIEEHDLENDEYNDIDPGFGPTATFDTESEARDFAALLQGVAFTS